MNGSAFFKSLMVNVGWIVKKSAVDASSADVCLKFWNESQTVQEPRPKPSNSGTFFASAMSDSVPIRSMLSSAM